MTATGKRKPRVTVSFTQEELGLINARSGNQASAHLKALALRDIGSDDSTCRHLYALGMTLNEALTILIEESEGQVPIQLICQLSALRDAIKTLQRQAVMEQSISVEECLRQIHDAVGGNKFSHVEVASSHAY